MCSPDLRVAELEKERQTDRQTVTEIMRCVPGDHVFLFYQQCYTGGGIIINWVMETGFHVFSSLFGQEFPVMTAIIFGLSDLIWFLVECCQDRPLTFPIVGS